MSKVYVELLMVSCVFQVCQKSDVQQETFAEKEPSVPEAKNNDEPTLEEQIEEANVDTEDVIETKSKSEEEARQSPGPDELQGTVKSLILIELFYQIGSNAQVEVTGRT